MVSFKMGFATGYICTRCLRAQQRRAPLAVPYTVRSFSAAPLLHSAQPARNSVKEERPEDSTTEKERGAMSRRLTEMAEETMEREGKSSRKVMRDAGFSEDLKKQLEERIEQSTFRSENAAAFAQIDMPSSAGKGTRDQAAAQPWTGTEAVEDTALRMLTDAHKPIRVPVTIPQPIGGPVNLRPRKKAKQSTGERLVNARDKASIYEITRESEMSEKEREQIRKELKERFTPGARPMPTTLQGLASLANERIEDAIARGQFKNIPRGKGKNVERDHNADSPFLDTTEYFMNKIIQKQEIVPPWIEKQQELIKQTESFRKRLRSDWRRHAARMIASRGGPVDQHIKRAQAYAEAEAKLNPKKTKTETMSAIDPQGNLSQVTVQQTPPKASSDSQSQTSTIHVTEEPASNTIISTPSQVELSELSSSFYQPIQTVTTFRDPDWLNTESGYHKLAISSLNSLTRSYNLMAPKVAQKPYYSLTRELNACFADVAPQLAGEIEQRAKAPERIRVEILGHRSGGVMEKFGASERVRVWDERRPAYGFKQFWRDLWAGKEEGVKA